MKSTLGWLTLAVLPLLLLPMGALAGNAHSKPIVIHPTKHDLSPALSELVAAHPRETREEGEEEEMHAPGRTRPLPQSPFFAGRDTALQTEALPPVGTIPGLNFDGVGANGYIPPDTNGSIGATQYFQIVNVEFGIYDKTSGNLLLGPSLINTIWSGFGGDCDTGGNGGDPVVLWDKAAQRWVVSQLSGTYNDWCMAVSTSSDATGSYYRYAFPSNGNLDDYPKLGVWPDAYYRATNTFVNKSTFGGANACAFDRSLMLSGGAANEICFQQSGSVASLLPSDVDGSTAPPSGEPNFFVELYDTADLGLFKFHVDFTNPTNSTFTGPTVIPVASFAEACGGGGCIPQPGTSTVLDSLGDRLMFRLAYRNFGSYENLLVNHAITSGSSVGERWYEIRSPNSSPTVFQQGTFAPDSNFRWMGSVASDQSGDIALGYSVSSSSVNPAVRYTGRVPTDPAGTMETEDSIMEGSGSQTGSNRWGDYSAMSVDSIDDCTFWYTNEYYSATSGGSWNTRIGSFKFSGCGSTTPDFYLSSNPSAQSVVQGNTATYTETVNPINGYSNTVTLTVASGCPTGATCTISPSSVGPPYSPSTLTVVTSSSTAGGSYTITIKGTDGTLTHTTSVTLTVTAPDFTLSSSTGVQTIKAGQTANYPLTLTSLNTFHGSVNLTISGLASNSKGTFSPNPVTLTSGGTASSTLSVATTKRTPPGTYTLTITGTSGTSSHSITVSLGVTRK